jgi:hypothetical protein
MKLERVGKDVLEGVWYHISVHELQELPVNKDILVIDKAVLYVLETDFAIHIRKGFPILFPLDSYIHVLKYYKEDDGVIYTIEEKLFGVDEKFKTYVEGTPLVKELTQRGVGMESGKVLLNGELKGSLSEEVVTLLLQ